MATRTSLCPATLRRVMAVVLLALLVALGCLLAAPRQAQADEPATLTVDLVLGLVTVSVSGWEDGAVFHLIEQ